MKKILIGCAGIGGESDKWDDINNDITHVEIDLKIANVIKKRKPNRTVIIGDAYSYLLDNFKKYDFIWFSPTCQVLRNCVHPDLGLHVVKGIINAK